MIRRVQPFLTLNTRVDRYRRTIPLTIDGLTSSASAPGMLIMNALRRRPQTKNWIRFAFKLGLLATDASVLAAIGRMLTERNDSREVLRPHERLSADLHAQRGWSHSSTLLVGAALGVGFGMLFAPVSGEEARTAIRDRAMNVRDKVSDAAAWASRLGPSSTYRRSTGTYAD